METDKKNVILREGFLVKRGHLVHNWKARWFVLMPDKLLYFKFEGGKRDSCQRGKILLKDCEITNPFLEHENRPLVFKIRTKNKVDHFLEACSREERDDWASDITAVVDKLGTAEGGKVPDQEDQTESQLHNINLSKVLDAMYDVHSGIKMSNHVEQGSTYSNCFSGSAVIDWLVFMQLALTRVESMTLASALLEEGFLRTVGMRSVEALRTAGLSELFMDDSTALYSFSDNLKKRGCVKAETSLSAVELSGKVIKRGYLLKQGHRRKNWKVRLFVLRSEPGFLHYYDPTKDDVSPVGGFSLRSCLVSSLDDNGVPSGVKGNIQGNLFKIITQSDVHYFIQAPTHQEKMDWIDAIREHT
ncbi:pleckstrin-2 [Cheilinus undulatus]|uniref:pleckstrin-2 n=1 Tax=Cheilinus undulatus TaxID=241271 RepID=UPI001BD421B2|nr:pleckstrin-2 [Cheilinus undulatus]XP_041668990.1 pleckstrin-2 [Cheilinus undulatus]XP_041668991.1 pleckstrin-2 [Cheilinus undulatus]XP_041668992.1 pleckstrin-2 [Cheilinus undulatus]XP_041668993.1 pleckstrin-2 [Cheilinus undulatus]XP_041668994.1 pleckstrin-2 [Cheilinus undulatus]